MKHMSQCQQAQQQKYPSFQNQISDRSYKIRTKKVIKGKKGVMRKKKPSKQNKTKQIASFKQNFEQRSKATYLRAAEGRNRGALDPALSDI